MSQSNLFQKYCIDACAILDFWDTQPKTRPYHVKVKTFRSIWDHISSKVEDGSIVIPKVIADEISSDEDEFKELKEWIDHHKKVLINHSHCIAELQKIVTKYPIYTTNKGSLPDAIVVAIAMSSNSNYFRKFFYSTEDFFNLKFPLFLSNQSRFDCKVRLLGNI